MNYFSLYRSWIVVQAVEVSNAVLGAAVRLLSFASSDGVESPRLVGARGWDQRRWMICCQVSEADVEAVVVAELAHWEGDDLLLQGFDSKGARRLGKEARSWPTRQQGRSPKTPRQGRENEGEFDPRRGQP